jgi:hypothetical protein
MYPALPDVRQLNKLKRMNSAAEIAMSGMWLGVDDGVLNPRTVKLGPRKIIVAADKDSLSPLQTGANFELSEAMVSKLQGSIRKTLMADQLAAGPGRADRLRVERARRYDSQAARPDLRPPAGRIPEAAGRALLRPGVPRAASSSRAGVVAWPDFSVRYVSPMARAQKLDEVNAVEAVFASAGQMATIDPTVMDELDPREAIKIITEGRGAPASIRRSPDDVAKLRQARADGAKQAQAEAAAAQTQQVGAEAAAKQAAVAA